MTTDLAVPLAAATAAASAATPAAPALGFTHFLAQSDAVGHVLLGILVLMSVVSWALIVTKGVAMLTRQRHSRAFLRLFWNASSLDAVQNELNRHAPQDPFSRLTAHAIRAQAHHARYGASRLEEAGNEQDFLTRTIKKVLDEETLELESGLAVLATVGATAPFVGLFGTVWGVYHALLAIGQSGSSSLDQIAGPVGEALIMTGIGLAVAIPAVMGYNWLTRRNRVITAKLDAFAFELFAFLSTGHALKGGAAGASGAEARNARPA